MLRKGMRTPPAGSSSRSTTLFGRRVMLRTLELADFPAWSAVRVRSADWLLKWEPRRVEGAPDPSVDRDAFAMRCSARQRELQLGAGYGFGIFVDGQFVGEINLSSIQRGAFQSGYVGYWIDESAAGHGYVPESLVVLMRFAFDELFLHRLQIAIIPRNAPSRRVMEKLNLRAEGVAARYLEIDGVWEDHVRYAMTAEEWDERSADLEAGWL